MSKLADGSEKGLKGHFEEDFSHRTHIGLAPRAGHVDRHAPYKRIATEEAWTFPEDPLGPDILLTEEHHRQTWPFRQDVPMHFAHPKFGIAFAK